MLSFLFLAPSFLHLSLAHVGAFWHDAPCVRIGVCFEGLCSFSEAVCACSSYLLYLDPPCTKFIHSGRHFTLQLPSFLWILTQNTIIHMQICFGGPPTISKYMNATGGPPLFSKQSFEINAHGENFPYSLEGRKQVQIKIHTLWVFQKLTKARKRPCQATSLEKS